MPERQKYIDVKVKENEINKVGDKWVQKEISKTYHERVFETVDLYNEAGEIIGSHEIPVMESYEE